MSDEPKDTANQRNGSDEPDALSDAPQDELIEAEFVAVDDAPDEPSAPPAPKRSWSVVAAIALALFALAISLLGAVTPRTGPGTDNDRAIADLDQRLAQLAARPAPSNNVGGEVDALQAELSETQSALAETQARLDALADSVPVATDRGGETVPDLAQRLAALEAAPAAKAAEISALSARVDALSDAVAAQRAAADELSAAVTDIAARLTGVRASGRTGGASAAAALAFAALEEATADGRAFTIEYEAAAAHFSDEADFERLSAYAETGAPTLADLNSQFRTIARDVRGSGDTSGGLVDQVSRAVTGVVTVRRSDAPETDAIGDILVRAQARLERGDLAAAIGEMGRLEGPAAESAEGWITAAAARRELDGAISVLRTHLIGG